MIDPDLHNTTEEHVEEANTFSFEEEERKSRFLLPGVPVVPQLAVALGILVLVFGVTYISDARNLIKNNDESGARANVATSGETDPVDPFADISIQATSAYVWDMKSQRALYNKNADEQLPLASVAKLMTALLAYELLGDDAKVTIGADAIAQDGESGLLSGEQFSLRELIDLTLITSSNDGAYALASAAGASIEGGNYGTRSFVELMNIRTEEIGLSRTTFNNTTGLDISESEAGAHGSARDVAFLMEYLIAEYPSVFEMTRERQAYIANNFGLTHDAANTNYQVGNIAGVLASKTGYTTLAGGNLVVAFDAGLNHPVIVAVLGSSYNGRFSDVTTLIEAAKAALNTQ